MCARRKKKQDVSSRVTVYRYRQSHGGFVSRRACRAGIFVGSSVHASLRCALREVIPAWLLLGLDDQKLMMSWCKRMVVALPRARIKLIGRCKSP